MMFPFSRPGMGRSTVLALVLCLAGWSSASAQQPDLTYAEELTGDFASALVMDAETGEILVAHNALELRQPASMVKMMTELLILESLEEGAFSLTDIVTVSGHASQMGGSQVYLKEGEQFTVEDLLMAITIHSANDAAVSLAEFHSGSKEAFIDLMNLRAQELAMARTRYQSVHGLPAGWNQEADLTCAYDQAILGRKLISHDLAVTWGGMATAPFRDGEFTLYNPNKLIGNYRGLDGIKTGFHQAAGYCLTATAVQKGRRLISVVMGCPTDDKRATETTRLLSYGFNLYVTLPIIEQAGQPLEHALRVKDGKEREVSVGYGQPLTVFVRRDRAEEVTVEMRLDEDVTAPVLQGQAVGVAIAKLGARSLGEVPIIALEAVERGNLFQRIFN